MHGHRHTPVVLATGPAAREPHVDNNTNISRDPAGFRSAFLRDAPGLEATPVRTPYLSGEIGVLLSADFERGSGSECAPKRTPADTSEIYRFTL
jgi:hypothetical protein